MRSNTTVHSKVLAVSVGVLAAVVLNLGPVFAYSSTAAEHRNQNSYKNSKTVTQPVKDEQTTTNSETTVETEQKVSVTTNPTAPKQYLTRTNKPAGDNGTVKTHKVTTPTTDIRDNPKVCAFYLDAFQFDGRQSVDWYIVKHTHGAKVLSGSIVLNSGGHGYTQNYSLPNGMYKLYWNFDGEHGSAKHKVFKVQCGEVKGDTTPETPTNPSGKGGDEKPQGHILSASTVKSGELVNTGTSPIVSTVLALMLLAASAMAFLRKPAAKPDFNDIAL